MNSLKPKKQSWFIKSNFDQEFSNSIRGSESEESQHDEDGYLKRPDAQTNMSKSQRKFSLAQIENEVQAHISVLKSHAEVVEYSVPLLNYKTEDEIKQVKRFILVYYRPILSSAEIDSLE